MSNPIPVKKLFTRPRYSRLRRLKLLPAPTKAKINGVWLDCYRDPPAVLAELERLVKLGSDRWMDSRRGPGRPRLEDIARLAGVYHG